MSKRLVKMLIMGPPGSGKGTISKRIIKRYNMKHVSSGDMLRTHVNSRSQVGVMVDECLNLGKLVPDDVMDTLISGVLIFLRNESWLLDGFPRTVTQAKSLSQYETISNVINLDVPFDEIVKRLDARWVHPGSGRVYNMEWSPPKNVGFDDETGEPLIQREDDKPATVRRRLEVYKDVTDPIIQFYKRTGSLENFQGRQTDEIWPNVQHYIDKLFV